MLQGKIVQEKDRLDDSSWYPITLTDAIFKKSATSIDVSNCIENYIMQDASETDLNNYIETGVYKYSFSSIQSNVGYNLPISSFPTTVHGILVVDHTSGSGSLVTQTLILANERGSEGRTYIRSRASGTWGDWKEIDGVSTLHSPNLPYISSESFFDSVVDNGRYNGVVFIASSNTAYMFNMEVINDYAVDAMAKQMGISTGTQQVTQSILCQPYSIDSKAHESYRKTRTGRKVGSSITWGGWKQSGALIIDKMRKDLNASPIINGKYWEHNGSRGENVNFSSTDLIDISNSTHIEIYNALSNQYNVCAYLFFDSDNNIISHAPTVTAETVYSEIVFNESNPIPSNAKWLAVSSKTAYNLNVYTGVNVKKIESDVKNLMKYPYSPVKTIDSYPRRGYYNRENGNFISHNDYYATEKIDIRLAKNIIIRNTFANQYNVASYCFFDAIDNFISSNEPVTEPTHFPLIKFDETNPIPEGAAYIAVAHSHDASVPGSVEIKYDDFYNQDVKLQSEIDILNFHDKSSNKVISQVASMSSGNTLTLDAYPQILKKGDKISFSAYFSSYSGSITIGKGFNTYAAKFVEITSNSVILKSFDTEERIIETTFHGISLNTFIKVFIEIRATEFEIQITTLNGIYKHTFINQEGGNGIVKVSTTMPLTNVELSAYNNELDNDVWAFGDSYFGITSSWRELYYLNQWNNLNFMVGGYPGMNSSVGYDELMKCLKFHTPKFLIWCLGMNDNGNINIWKGYIDNIVQMCKNNNITLILSTIPKPKNSIYVNKPEMSSYVRSLDGVRVLDVEKAVGANTTTGEWYGNGQSYDYQSSDNVHPSETGARAIAMQFLIDVPEIAAVETKEVPTNKVAVLTSSSTDNQYPSAKCVFDSLQGIIEGGTMENIEWSALKAKRDNSQLGNGKFYRIIDYKATSIDASSACAGHDFDIIVLSLSSNILCETAFAHKRYNDTYFSGKKLNAWQLKYCIDNDTSRFVWADSVNGKGVIYYMKDEYENEAPYDFKNIMFYRTLDSDGNYVAEGGTKTAVYTFDKNVNGVHSDISLIGGCKNNIIKEYIQNSKYSLPDNVFLDTNTTASYNNMLGVNSIHNTFGSNCYYNTIGCNSHSNVFGNGCSYNTITDNAYRNVFGNSCSFNTINDNVYNCTFGIECYRNSIGCTCSFNKFGNYFQSNTLGCYCNSNTFSEGCKDNIFGGTNINNTFGKNFQKNVMENYCQSNVFGDSVQQNHFGIGFSNSSIGASSYFNSIGNNCTYIKTNKSFYNNKLGDGCKYLNFNYDNTRNAFVFNGTGQKFTSYQSVRCVWDDCMFVGIKSDGTLRTWSPANT